MNFNSPGEKGIGLIDGEGGGGYGRGVGDGIGAGP